MPHYTKNTIKRIEKFAARLAALHYEKLAELECTAFVTKEPLPFERREEGGKKSVALGEPWGELFDCAWFHFTGALPSGYDLPDMVLLINLSGEGLYVNRSGVPMQGLTAGATAFEFGTMPKHVLSLDEDMLLDGKVDIWIDAGCNNLFGKMIGEGRLLESHIALRHPELRSLSYDVSVLKDAMEQLPEESPHRYSILYALNAAANEMYDYTDEEAVRARAILKPELAKKGATPSMHISAIGHAHIDLAWRWPIRETIRKGARTFSTMDRMMERYPDYKFGVSQPQLLVWMKRFYPALFERLKVRAAEGRLECQGAMWVEPDTNLAGGEALVRQILYGQRFWREEFGVEPKNIWLPDVFGYTGALPQIMKKSGVPYFMTHKLSWNEHNTFPHHTFRWTGIDGSTVLANLTAEGTYNSPASPESIRKIEKNYLDKGVSEHALMLFGVGDGGGGPGTNHLERLARLKNFADFSPVEQRFAGDFFALIDHDTERYAEWKGELYFEYHRGTYTSQALNKMYNRKLEYALRELEYAYVLAGKHAGLPFPRQEIDEIWKEVLLYQFHDILPGSSIKRVYDESVARYRKLYARVNELIGTAYGAVANGETVFNSLSFPRREYLLYNGAWQLAELPAMGSAKPQPLPVIEGLAANESILENERLQVRFGSGGTIVSIFDKAAEREALASDEAANRFCVYDDRDGNAWDIQIYYDEQTPRQFSFVSASWEIDGPNAVRTQTFQFGSSTLRQKIILQAGCPYLIFDTEVSWHEREKMLRTAFPVNVYTDEVACDIQFGSLKRPTHRNTSWDMTRFEICAHKWIDLSRADYGAALMNDCKYGHKALGNIMELALLRSSIHPGIEADQGEHRFRYAFYPHQGDEKAARVEQTALAFNISPVVISGAAPKTPEALFSVSCPNIEVAAVKPAEDGNGIILRLFETDGVAASCRLSLAKDFVQMMQTDLMERELNAVALKNGEADLSFGPFEILTLKIR